jgi:hypothetical protein
MKLRAVELNQFGGPDLRPELTAFHFILGLEATAVFTSRIRPADSGKAATVFMSEGPKTATRGGVNGSRKFSSQKI